MAPTAPDTRGTLAAQPEWRRAGFGPPNDRLVAILLVCVSSCGSLGGIGLWIAGHGVLGLRVASGSVLLILCSLLGLAFGKRFQTRRAELMAGLKKQL